MGAKRFETSKLPSRRVTERAARVPHRSCQAAAARACGGECERMTVAISQRASGAGRASCADRKASIGRTSRNLENVKFEIDQKVVYLVSDPISGMGGAVGLQNSLAPAGAMAKVAEMTELPFPEPAGAFDGGADLQAVAKRRDADLRIGIGGQRPKRRRRKGGPGMGAAAVRLDLDVCAADVVALARGLEGAGQSPSKRRAEDLCGSSRTRPQGRGFPCGWEGESCL
jgi:hypothetical protein